MGMATYIENAVNTALSLYVVSNSDAVISVMIPIAVTAVTGYVMWTGFQVARGEVRDSISTVAWRWFRVALIAGLALNGPQYRSIVKDGLDGIQEAFAFAFGGGGTVGATIDAATDPIETLMETIFNDAATGIVPNFALFIAGFLCAAADICMAFVATAVFLLAKVMLAVLLSVGPAFIFCAMFPATQRYAESWLSSALVAVFTNVLIMAVVSFLASIVRTASFNIIAAYSTASIMADVVGLLLLSLIASYILLHVPSIAASLAGGLTLGNPGGDSARLGAGMLRGGANVTGSVMATLTDMVKGLSNTGPGGRLSLPKSGAPLGLPAPATGPGRDLYQRGTMERLRQLT